MALSAEKMAEAIASAIESKTSSPIFKARCYAGQDVSREIWEVVCRQIIEHIQNNMDITIPSLTVESGIDVGNWYTDANGNRLKNITGETMETGSTVPITINSRNGSIK